MGKWQVNRDNYSVTMDLGPDCEWVAEMQWPDGVTQGGPAVLIIYPSNPDTCPAGGLSQTVLREVDFKYALERLRGGLASSKRWDTARKRGEAQVTSALVAHSDAGITPEYLVLLSRVYVGAVNQGQAKPLEYLADLTGKTPAAIKNHLWQATRKGYLERSPGRAGGNLTVKAGEIMETIIPSGLVSLGDTLKRARKVRS